MGYQLSDFPKLAACLWGPVSPLVSHKSPKTPGVTVGVSGCWICCEGLGDGPQEGGGQPLRAARVGVAQPQNPCLCMERCSYLPPVLTPHSSCFKSLLLIFTSLLLQPHPVLLFLVFLFF